MTATRATSTAFDRARRLLTVAASALALAALANGPVAPARGDAAAPEAEMVGAPAEPAFAFRWRPEAVNALIAEVAAARREGLDPADYRADTLVAELSATGGSARLDELADRVALDLAHDYLLGRVVDRRGLDWHIERDDDDPARLRQALDIATAQGRVRPWLRSLLPGDPRYAALRDAYAVTPAADAATHDRLRVNLERWRWMPRSLGENHIFVNVPRYMLDVVQGNRTVSSYTVVVGARATPTPQIGVAARSVVVNPWWRVPTSIVRSSGLAPGARSAARGYVFQAVGGTYAVAQRPGPGNALGRVKIDMPNPHAIYLHDTPSKAFFERPSRAYSHGCIRVKDIDRLAAELAALDAGDAGAGRVRTALAGNATETLPLQHERPVWLVYFTAEVSPTGQVVAYEDPYSRDATVKARLDRAEPLSVRAPLMASAAMPSRG